MKTLVRLAALAVMTACTFGCTSVPVGADATQYRLRESQLNLDTAAAAVPLASFSESDQEFIQKVIAGAQAGVKVALAATSHDASVEALQDALDDLQDLVDAQPEGKAKVNAQRILAVLDVTLQVLRNREQLQQEFSTPPAAPTPAS